MNRSRRIVVVDALRGLALAGILILHNNEKFDAYLSPDQPWAFLSSLDGFLGGGVYHLFGGKSYAIFSMLFGFSFWIQYERMRDKGYDLGGRYAWRLCLLLAFGLIHSLYYAGDLLQIYAAFGFLVIAVRKAPDWLLLTMAVVLLALPLQLGEVACAWLDPAYTPFPMNGSWPYWDKVTTACVNGGFLDVIRTNINAGLKANLLWNWEAGRFFHIPGLFLLGMLAARRRAFTTMRSHSWIAICLLSLAAALVLGRANAWIPGHLADGSALRITLGRLLGTYANLAGMLLMVSAFILLWRVRIGERLFGFLIPYGRMSLTNYVIPGLVGLFVYYNCGFGMWHHFGGALCTLTGLVMLILQIAFSRWCLKRLGQGPLEKLWRRLMWIGGNPDKPVKSA